MFQNRCRRIGQTTYTASEAKPLDLPRKWLYRQLVVNVDGELTIATAGAPVLYTGGIASALRMVSRIEIIANGRDTIKSLSPDAIAMKNLFLFGSKPVVIETGITAATHPFGGKVILPFAMPRAIKELDTVLNSGKLSTFEARVTYGGPNAMFATPPTAHTIDSVNVEFHLVEAIRLDGKDEPYSSYKELFIEKAVTAVSAEFQVQLSVGNRYRGFLIETESDGNMVNTIINSVKIQSGTDVYFSMDMDALQAFNQVFHSVEAQTFVGYAYVDFCPEGRLVDALDATRLSSLDMILNVAHPGTVDKVRVYPCEIIPPAAI